MFDAVVVNGSVVDGTGAPARTAGIGIRGGRIAEIGRLSEDGGVTIDAAGMVVAPGFIDLHSHYDAQVFWDPTLSPSCLHGVTTVVAGNCGLTLAPCEEKDQDFLTRLLARVEAIPIEALLAGVHYTWRSYPEFLDVVAARPLGPEHGLHGRPLGPAPGRTWGRPPPSGRPRRTSSVPCAASSTWHWPPGGWGSRQRTWRLRWTATGARRRRTSPRTRSS